MDRSQTPVRRLPSHFRMPGAPGLRIATLVMVLGSLPATGAHAGAGHALSSAARANLANAGTTPGVSAEGILLALAFAGFAVVGGLLLPIFLSGRAAHAGRTVAAQAERSRTHALQAALDAMSQGVLVIAEDRTITVINDRAVSLLGLPANAAGSRLCLAAEDEPTVPSFRPQMLAPALQGVSTYDCETPEGLTLEIEARIMPRGSHIVRCTDVTERNRARQDLAKSAATRNSAAPVEFLTMMSHEIRTPLNGIVGLADSILDIPLEPKHRQYVDALRGSAENLLDIVNEVLDFAKLEGDRVEVAETEFELDGLLQGVVDMLAPRAQAKGLFIASIVDASVPATLVGDPALLRQVLVNLVGNGVKFTSTGFVIIDARAVKRKGGVETLEIHIRDSGIGITDAAMPHLFEEYFQADASISRRFGGTGLGLAISRRIMERLGGTLGVDSWLDVGSTFKIGMPLGSRSQADEGEGARPNPDTPARPQTLAGHKISRRRRKRRSARDLFAPVRGRGRRNPRRERRRRRARPAARAVCDALRRRAFRRDLGYGGIGCIRRGVAHGPRACRHAPDPGHGGDAASRPIRAAHDPFDAVLAKPMPGKKLALAFGAPDVRPVQHSAALLSIGKVRAAPPIDRGIVLIVEDVATNRLVLGMLLQKLGYRFVSVGSGKEAVAAVKGQRYDAILMDLMMPEMDGLTATRIIRALPAPACDIPIIALTASILATDEASAQAAGVDDLATKPITRNQLEQDSRPRDRGAESRCRSERGRLIYRKGRPERRAGRPDPRDRARLHEGHDRSVRGGHRQPHRGHAASGRPSPEDQPAGPRHQVGGGDLRSR